MPKLTFCGIEIGEQTRRQVARGRSKSGRNPLADAVYAWWWIVDDSYPVPHLRMIFTDPATGAPTALLVSHELRRALDRRCDRDGCDYDAAVGSIIKNFLDARDRASAPAPAKPRKSKAPRRVRHPAPTAPIGSGNRRYQEWAAQCSP